MQELLDIGKIVQRTDEMAPYFFRRTIRADGNPSAEAVAKHMAFASYTYKVKSLTMSFSSDSSVVTFSCLVASSNQALN